MRSMEVAAPGKTSEDVFVMEPSTRAMAVCDGASESFAAALWAGIVARGFARAGWISPGFPRREMVEYAQRFRGRDMSWYEQAAYRRGSYTTLLGVRLAPLGNYVDVLAVGDSLAVIVRDGRAGMTFPYRSTAEYGKDPLLVSTDPEANRRLREPGAVPRPVRWSFDPGHQYSLLLMTDALGLWFLRRHERGERPETELCAMTREAFSAWVQERQKIEEIRRDDCTLCVGTLV